MKKIAAILLSIALMLCITVVLVLNSSAVQTRLSRLVSNDFHKRTGATLSFEKVDFNILRGLSLHLVRMVDASGKPILTAERMDAGVQLLPLLQQEVSVDYLRMIRAHLRVSKESQNGLLNIEPILRGYRSSKKSTKRWNVTIKSLVFRECNIQYDVLNVPGKLNILDSNHLSFSQLSGIFKFRSIQGELNRLTVKKFQFAEKSGMHINKLEFDAYFNKEQLRIRNLNLISGSSRLSVERFVANRTKNAKKQDWIVAPFRVMASLVPSQFSFLSKKLQAFDQQLQIDASLSGSKKNLICTAMEINMGERFLLSGSFKASQWLNIQNSIAHADIKRLNVQGETLNAILGIFSIKALKQQYLNLLSSIGFQGTLDAQNKGFKILGEVQTPSGNLNTNIRLSKTKAGMGIEGNVESTSLNVNPFFGPKSLLGIAVFDMDINGLIKSKNEVEGTINGTISSLEYKGITLKNLAINGKINKQLFEGNASMNDPHGALNFVGLIDFTGSAPSIRMDLHATNFQPNAFGLLPNNPIDVLSFHLRTDLVGKTLDNLVGSIHLDSLDLKNPTDRLQLSRLTVELDKTLQSRNISIKSPILNAKMWGIYQLKNLGNDFKGMLNGFMPSLLTFEFKPTRGTDCHFEASLEPQEALFNMLKLPFQLKEKADLQGYFSEQTGKFRVRGNLPSVQYKNTLVNEAGFLLENPQKEAKLILFGQFGNEEDPITANLDIRGLNDLASFKLNLGNQGIHTYSGNISGNLHFYSDKNDVLAVDGTLDNSSLIVNDSLWHIQPATWKWQNQSLCVSNFQLYHLNQFVKIDGVASKNEKDTLHISLNTFSLDNIFDLMPKSNVKLGGKISGLATITKLFDKTSLDADLSVADFSLNKQLLGNLRATSAWDSKRKALVLDAKIQEDSANGRSRLVALGGGMYFPAKDSMFLSLDGHRLPLGFLEPYLGNILKKIDGYASGNIRIEGPMKQLDLTTKAFVENGSFGIGFLNTRYHFSDSILVTPKLVSFKNVEIRDDEGNQAIAYGTIRHNRFRNSITSIEFAGNNILAMDLPVNPDAYFYGKAYGSGTVSINGTDKEMVIDVNLKSEPNTNVTINFIDDKEVADAGFIQFVNHEIKRTEEDPFVFGKKARKVIANKVNDTKMIVNLQIEATPDAQLTLITDPSTGDDITGTGTGNIRCVYREGENMTLFGRYNIQKGKYKFIYQNLLRRDFTLEDGATITFSGDPFAAQLDLTANYLVNAKLSDLLPSDVLAGLNLNRSSIPVNCVLKLNGELQRPTINLGLDYPSADDDLVRNINDVINTDDALNQQLVFLMLFGRFSTPTMSSAQETANTSMSTVLNTGISTLSSQLNKVVNGVLGDANMNFNFNYKNSTYDANTPGEWGVMIGGNFFNNRLTVNSNLGSRENLVQNGGGSQFIGEFDANLKIKNSQKWSWKFFNRANDNRYFKSALNTQGVGILFKQDFNSIGELFGIKKEKERAVTPPSLPDSTGK